MSKTKVVHLMKEEYDVDITRNGKWGNPYSHKEGTWAQRVVATREEAIGNYRDYVLGNEDLLNSLHELKGKTLGCWCKPTYSCHGDILVDLVNERLGEDE